MTTKIFYFFIKRWCRQNGWTEPFLEEEECYAFPPNAVIPQRIPVWWNDSYEFGRTIEMSCIGLLASLIHASILLLGIFLWNWRGIGSIYISQVENQKFLACHYCPMTPGVLVEMKDSSQGLFEVQSEFLPKTMLIVTDYSGSYEVKKLVSKSEVKGRILYLFPPNLKSKN